MHSDYTVISSLGAYDDWSQPKLYTGPNRKFPYCPSSDLSRYLIHVVDRTLTDLCIR